MGQLVDGAWQDLGFNIKLSNGKYLRKGADFRNWITVDGSPGSSGKGGFEAEAGRYHLYVSLACPWAHRTLIFRKLKGLEKIISYSVVNPYMGEQGWSFTAENGELTGFAVEVVQAIQKRIDSHDKIEFIPWARGYQYALAPSKKDIILFATAFTEERRELFKWVGPIAQFSWVFSILKK